jgi:peptide/nickel transport system permease protein
MDVRMPETPHAVVASPLVTTPSRSTRQRRGYWASVARKLATDRLAMGCAALLVVIALSAILAPFVAPADPYKTSIAHRLLPVATSGHWLGTDELGRDLLSRLLYGGRISLLMGVVPVVLAALFGGLIGIAAGYAGGRWNMLVMRTLDVFFAFPSVLLAVALAGALGPGLSNCLVALTIVLTLPIARVAESATTQIRNHVYIEAARATGASSGRIIFGHVLGNVLGPILTYSSSQISVAIVLASGLSFLGLGVSPPAADWGLMLNTLRQSLFVAPVNAVLPGAMIFASSICFNLLSGSIRSAMDVRP